MKVKITTISKRLNKSRLRKKTKSTKDKNAEITQIFEEIKKFINYANKKEKNRIDKFSLSLLSFNRYVVDMFV